MEALAAKALLALIFTRCIEQHTAAWLTYRSARPGPVRSGHSRANHHYRSNSSDAQHVGGAHTFFMLLHSHRWQRIIDSLFKTCLWIAKASQSWRCGVTMMGSRWTTVELWVLEVDLKHLETHQLDERLFHNHKNLSSLVVSLFLIRAPLADGGHITIVWTELHLPFHTWWSFYTQRPGWRDTWEEQIKASVWQEVDTWSPREYVSLTKTGCEKFLFLLHVWASVLTSKTFTHCGRCDFTSSSDLLIDAGAERLWAVQLKKQVSPVACVDITPALHYTVVAPPWSLGWTLDVVIFSVCQKVVGWKLLSGSLWSLLWFYFDRSLKICCVPGWSWSTTSVSTPSSCLCFSTVCLYLEARWSPRVRRDALFHCDCF